MSTPVRGVETIDETVPYLADQWESVSVRSLL